MNADDTLRTALDARGLLIPGALPSPERKGAYVIFAQRSDARVEWAKWCWYARYFGARLRLTAKKSYPSGGWVPQTDAAGVVVAPSGGGVAGTRLVYGRRGMKPDYNAAEAADRRSGFPGFDFLARDCGYVWLVVCAGEPDPHALVLAAVLSSVMLGPIVAPDGKQIFGVSGARERLAGMGIAGGEFSGRLRG